MGLISTSVSTQICHSGTYPKLVNNSPPCITQVLFKLLPLCWVGVSDIEHCPFKSRVSVSHSAVALPEC